MYEIMAFVISECRPTRAIQVSGLGFVTLTPAYLSHPKPRYY